MTKILISGLGLIGSSIARIMQSSHEETFIMGSDPNKENIDFMLEKGFINKKVNFKLAAPKADLIVLAAPVSVINQQIKTLEKIDLKRGVLITDVGSTKVDIMQTAKNLMLKKHCSFMGGHPMAGSHLTGSKAGKITLFNNAYYFLINGNQTEGQTNHFKKLMKFSNVNFLNFNAQQHDQVVSEISHLPHIMAAGLVNMVNDDLSNQDVSLDIVAGGFKSVTRIAKSDPTVWTNISLSNKNLLLQQIDKMCENLNHFKKLLDTNNQDEIFQTFLKAQNSRKSLD
ncbi:prephenate dehydrogenase/arogenate dehydrogenase family protein [Lactobacillus sp. S2-2]|uniref:prephenate dehydrogenase n=1 Tax=Lactobacillus sp. S2-2 TaxID=2692917 RepID=UPI001F4785B7|nr:prephenate dehydrogenase/arogenate dehydrogenase family protein [Lactobacillus sp. S2-2]MCF6514604.1 prephenate dehydrogenase/arogenate dehydrogenase family protein [Lactobacillus sp. S2-2]